jgi:hypothetical protein
MWGKLRWGSGVDLEKFVMLLGKSFLGFFKMGCPLALACLSPLKESFMAFGNRVNINRFDVWTLCILIFSLKYKKNFNKLIYHCKLKFLIYFFKIEYKTINQFIFLKIIRKTKIYIMYV